MRGARSRPRGAPAGPRIIPAHAGSTSPTSTARMDTPDHPRTCGEHVLGGAMWSCVTGSSPHMRGARAQRQGHRARGGIIPTHAGSTRCSERRVRASWDHPRTCGEHKSEGIRKCLDSGSSPHMRGAHGLLGVALEQLRIIPAHAGSTRTAHRGGRTSADHPRTCGEHLSQRVAVAPGTGSSPHMRGALDDVRGLLDLGRIIPAHAGSTPCRRRPRRPPRDHPRTCGEHRPEVEGHDPSSGSSPHMRGAR